MLGVGVDGRHPSLRGGAFHLRQFVEAFRLENQVHGRFTREADDEVRHVVVRLAVVQVGNGEAEARVLHERLHLRMRVEDVGRRLLPHLRVRDDVVQVTLHHLADVLAGPVVHVGRGARPA